MVPRFDLTVAAILVMTTVSAIAQPAASPPANSQPAGSPAIRALAEGTLPIVACHGPTDPGSPGGGHDAENPDMGCVEVLFDSAQPPVACWTLPLFGTAAVGIEPGPAEPVAEGSPTRRMTIRFHPFSAVPPATSATLHFGFSRPGAPLVCDQTLVVQRPAGVLDLPPQLDLGVLHAELWGAVSGSPLRQAVFPAAGQPPIGPITLSTGTDLHAAGRRGSAVPVSLAVSTGTVMANRFDELTVTVGSADSFPALGALSGPAWVTAPQLLKPVALTIRADSQIGWFSILATLLLGIVAGGVVHHRILPRQALAKARLEGERSAVSADRLSEREHDQVLRNDLNAVITRQRDNVRAATDPAAITKAVETMDAEMTARLTQADDRRQALAAAVAPARSALRTLPAVSELPETELDAWSDALDKTQALIDDGKIADPQAMLNKDIPPHQRAALDALTDFASRAGAALHNLDRWTRAPAKQVFSPLQAVTERFDLPSDPQPVETLVAMRDAQHALRRAAGINHPAIAGVLRDLAGGAANARFPNAADRTEAILADLDRKPVAALTQLAVLVQDYDAFAKEKGGASFEALADVGRGVEGGPVPPAPVERRIELPDEPGLRIETEPGLPVTGQDVTIRVLGLAANRTARIWTPHGSARIVGLADPVLTIRPPHPGPVPIEIVTADTQGHVLSRQSLTLIVRPVADHAINTLVAEVRRSDWLATVAAGGIGLVSGALVFSVVPLTSWWGLLAPLLWGFFANLNLPQAIQSLQTRRDAILKPLGIT